MLFLHKLIPQVMAIPLQGVSISPAELIIQVVSIEPFLMHTMLYELSHTSMRRSSSTRRSSSP